MKKFLFIIKIVLIGLLIVFVLAYIELITYTNDSPKSEPERNYKGYNK